MTKRYNPPPNWPPAPAGWTPPPGWQPDPAWGPAPPGWEVWADDKDARRKTNKTILKAFGAVVVGLLVIAGLGALFGGDDDEGTIATSDTSTSTPTDEESSEAETTSAPPTPAAAPTPNPDASYTHSCDYVLGDFSERTKRGYRFIAQAQIENTGNVAVEVEVTARWVQVGSKPLRMKKLVTVEWTDNKTVNFTMPTTSDEIGLHQAYDGDKSCGVKVDLVNVVGDAHPE